MKIVAHLVDVESNNSIEHYWVIAPNPGVAMMTIKEMPSLSPGAKISYQREINDQQALTLGLDLNARPAYGRIADLSN